MVRDSLTTTSTGSVAVQRHYRTWQWTPNNDKSETYQINFRVEGKKDGHPILLTHGIGANLNHFRYTIPALAQAGYKVYAMDLLGFGASEKPKNASFSIELFMQQILDFCASRNEEKPWVLCGNSIGGLASLAAAAAYGQVYFTSAVSKPLEIACLVLFNSAGGMTGFRYSDIPTWAHGIMGHIQYFLLGQYHGPFLYRILSQRRTIEAVLKNGGIYQDTTNLDDELYEILLGPSRDPGARDVFLSVFSGPAGPTRESLIPKVKVPVLALWGETLLHHSMMMLGLSQCCILAMTSLWCRLQTPAIVFTMNTQMKSMTKCSNSFMSAWAHKKPRS